MFRARLTFPHFQSPEAPLLFSPSRALAPVLVCLRIVACSTYLASQLSACPERSFVSNYEICKQNKRKVRLLHAYPGVCGRAGIDTPIARPGLVCGICERRCSSKIRGRITQEIGVFVGKQGIRNHELTSNLTSLSPFKTNSRSLRERVL